MQESSVTACSPKRSADVPLGLPEPFSNRRVLLVVVDERFTRRPIVGTLFDAVSSPPASSLGRVPAGDTV